ncbi:LysR family transcriptional regulator [Thalassobaculum sp. OXR-137]|uniref:LysR family transcriptional regulator n=1 Tax=Thalassobaculum sp. OXR-137 TaxID=3100173 RepID=UPI002AC99D9C|nr:LysR family transcriptional regulator [Thalassobaculum sp. OXR-137]WPZ35012.1 LysR family transcriptional regulator [Thalassobaculum sp. OXR-137]
MATLDILLLRSFVAVARAGSIRAAAERVGRTQSAVSLQMKRLEEIAGERLFHRTGSGVTLTISGERLMVGAERILSAHDETLASIRATGLQGAIAFGCPEDYLTAFFPDLLRRYGRDNPEVEIEIVCAPTVALRPMLQRRHIDLALVSVAGEVPADEVFRRESFVWIANSPSPDLLAGPVVPLALSGPDTLDHRMAKGAMEAAGLPYRITHASDGLAGLLAIARSGLAISVATRSAVPPDLHVVEQGLPALPQIGLSIAYASSRPAPVVRAFGEFIAGSLGEPSGELPEKTTSL